MLWLSKCIIYRIFVSNKMVIRLNKKYLMLLMIFVACLSIACVNAQSNNQNNSNTVNGGTIDFQGFFKMSFDKDMTFKRSESMVDELGCTQGYVNDKKDVYIYYYGNDVEFGVYEFLYNEVELKENLLLISFLIIFSDLFCLI